MAAWITTTPQTPYLAGTFSYSPITEISSWHTKHPSYQVGPILNQWGTTPGLVLSTTNYSMGGTYKKQIKQTKYQKNTTTIVDTFVFWLPVLFEGDPIGYDNFRDIRAVQPFQGTNLQQGAARYIYHLPLLGGLRQITDVLRIGDSYTDDPATYSPPIQIYGDVNQNPGRHVARDNNYDYYWEDTDDNPYFVKGTVSSTGPTVKSDQSLLSPFSNNIYVANPATFTSSKKKSQLYEYDKLTMWGKDIAAGSTFVGTGTTGLDLYYSSYAINPGQYGLSNDGKSYVSRVPIVIDKNVRDAIVTWKSASSTVPVKPTSVPLIAGNGVNTGFDNYMTKFASKWQNNELGFVRHATSTGWSDYAPGTSASIDVTTGVRHIVYPKYFMKTDGTSTAAQNSGAAASQWFTGNAAGGISFPLKGIHFGIFDNVTDANAWVAYYNNILAVKQSATVKDSVGYIFIAGPNWTNRFEVHFNPDGMTGISSKNSLLANINQPAGVGNTADVDEPSSGNDGTGSPGGGVFRVTMQYAVNTVTKQNVNMLIKQLMANEKLSFAQTKEKFMAEFIKARTKYRISQGTPAPEARAIALSRANVIFANASENTNSGGQGNTNAPPPESTIRIPIVRGLIGYQSPPSAIGDSPQLVQKYQYTQITTDDTGAERMELIPTERRFVFPFAPKDVTYSNLSSVWTEISRTGRHPIVDWTNFQLLKVSFTFELVDRNSTDAGQPRDGFGLNFSIDEKINILRQMATAPYPVSFLNMDTFFSKELRYPLYTQGRGVEFVITDFAVQSVQRTPVIGSAGLTSIQPNQISRASCTITLQECPIEQVDIISIPKITICPKQKCPPPTCVAPCEEKPKEFVYISTLTRKDTAPVVDPNE